MVAHSRAEQLAKDLPEERRAAFVHFVETGEAEKSFLDFVESDKTAKAAVEVMLHETAAVFERLDKLLHAAKTVPQTGDVMQAGHPHAAWAYIDVYSNEAVAPHPMNADSSKDVSRRADSFSDPPPTASTTDRLAAPTTSCDSLAQKVLEVGDRLRDGTIYAGISPNTGKAMFTTPADAPLTYTFNQARKYAAKLDANGHKDWRVPTKSELNVLWENRDKGALKGTFNVSGSYPAGWYWSSTEDDDMIFAWEQRFKDGGLGWHDESTVSSLRCVR